MTYAIRKTYHALSGGTRVELVDPLNQGFEHIAHGRGGYVTVRMVMTQKFRDQKNSAFIRHVEAHGGTFDIEADNLVKLRDGTL